MSDSLALGGGITLIPWDCPCPKGTNTIALAGVGGKSLLYLQNKLNQAIHRKFPALQLLANLTNE